MRLDDSTSAAFQRNLSLLLTSCFDVTIKVYTHVRYPH